MLSYESGLPPENTVASSPWALLPPIRFRFWIPFLWLSGLSGSESSFLRNEDCSDSLASLLDTTVWTPKIWLFQTGFSHLLSDPGPNAHLGACIHIYIVCTVHFNQGAASPGRWHLTRAQVLECLHTWWTIPNSAHLSGKPGLDIFGEPYAGFKTICQALCRIFIFELPVEVGVGGFQIELQVKAGV